MAAFRAGGPRQLGRVAHEQGENPLYIPPRGYTTFRGERAMLS